MPRSSSPLMSRESARMLIWFFFLPRTRAIIYFVLFSIAHYNNLGTEGFLALFNQFRNPISYPIHLILHFIFGSILVLLLSKPKVECPGRNGGHRRRSASRGSVWRGSRNLFSMPHGRTSSTSRSSMSSSTRSGSGTDAYGGRGILLRMCPF